MKPKAYRQSLLIFGGIILLGIFWTHFRYLILWTQDVIPGDTTDNDAPKTQYYDSEKIRPKFELFQLTRQQQQDESSRDSPPVSASTTRSEETIPPPSEEKDKAGDEALQSTAREEQKKRTPPPPFFSDALCGGCRRILVAPARGLTCGSEIAKTASERSLSLAEAAVLVANQTKGLCHPCLSCTEPSKAYWRFDATAPKIRAAKTHYLPSVDQAFRVPQNLLESTGDREAMFQTLEDYMSRPDNQKRMYMFDYNPSIVQLPDNQSHLRTEYPEAVYLASYRISNLQSCFPERVSKAMIGGNWDRRPEAVNWLGLALLDKDLGMIQDVVVKVPDMYVRWVDYRLFVLDGQIYVSSNCQMVPFWVNPDQASFQNNQVVHNVFPSPLQVAMARIPSVCSQDIPELQGAKNLNYFTDAHGRAMVEFMPAMPRSLRPVRPTFPELRYGPKPTDELKDESALPPPSFYTRDELDLAEQRHFYGQPFTTWRGSACCVSIQVPEEQIMMSRTNSSTLLLGITHVKTPFGRKKLKDIVTGNHYLSRFYAFEPTPPYRIVAHSGYFCLPANPSASSNPLADIPTMHHLTIGDTVYDCPAIHFVTGMVEKADDPSRLIIAYGVEDCTSWFIQVNKQEVIDLLFGPPKVEG